MIEIMLHAVEHTFFDTLKLFPVLMITYLILEYLETKIGDKTINLISKSGRAGPLIGALCGLFPQCGMAAAASNFYTVRIISAGTLLAVFLSTSDEMLPVLIAGSASPLLILKILMLKAGIGLFVGWMLDFYCRQNTLLKPQNVDVETFCRNENCKCEKGIWYSALGHSIKITLFVFVFVFLFNLLVVFVGIDRLTHFLSYPFAGPIVSGLLGLIPNCSVSVIVTSLYMEKAITFGTMMSGTLVGAGVGLLVLYRVNHKLKENLILTLILYISGVLAGLILDSF